MLSDTLATFSFARPLWLLALLPIPAICLWLHRTAGNRSGWDRVIPERLRRWLIDSSSTSKGDRRYLLLGCGWALAAVVLAGPSIEAQQPSATQNYAALFVVLDVSTNMLAGDLSPNRLERAKRKIHDVLALPDGRQMALVAYAGSAHRVTPLSDDDATIRNLLDALTPSIMPATGQNVGAALALAREQSEHLPRRSTQILLITSGVEGPDLEALEAHARVLGPQLAILGVGTAAGSPVALPEGGFMRDAQGRIVLPRLDSQALASLARRNGSSFHALTLDNRDIDRLLTDATEYARDESPQQVSIADQGHWLLLLLLPLAALGARRGWLGMLLLAAIVPLPAEAAWDDLWQRPDQQAAQLLEQGRSAEAAEKFRDRAWKAWSLYQTGAHEAAGEIFADLLQNDPDNPDHHVDYGTALAMSGRYNEALEAYEQALTRNPDHRIARHNRRHVEQWMKMLDAQQAEAEQRGEESPSDAGQQQDAPPEARSEDQSEPAQPEPVQPQANNADSPAPTEPQSEGASSTEPGAQGDAESADERSEGAAGEPVGAPTRQQLEQRQSLEQWLEDIPDDPAELLRRKFLYQHLQQREEQR